MKASLLIILFFFNLSFLSIDKEKIYNALAGDSYLRIDQLIIELEAEKPSSINKVYKGALLAKRAYFEKNAVKKINKFKEGVQLLESEIGKFPNEIEYRFLRLCIQESCPKILNYNNNITEDSGLIIQNFSKQSSKLKSIITNYSKNSNSLDNSLLK